MSKRRRGPTSRFVQLMQRHGYVCHAGAIPCDCVIVRDPGSGYEQRVALDEIREPGKSVDALATEVTKAMSLAPIMDSLVIHE